jgi:hypothetical protein
VGSGVGCSFDADRNMKDGNLYRRRFGAVITCNPIIIRDNCRVYRRHQAESNEECYPPLMKGKRRKNDCRDGVIAFRVGPKVWRSYDDCKRGAYDDVALQDREKLDDRVRMSEPVVLGQRELDGNPRYCEKVYDYEAAVLEMGMSRDTIDGDAITNSYKLRSGCFLNPRITVATA